MRVSAFIRQANWTHALGEVALIVIGVTIALAATAWYEDVQLRKTEIRTLEQLHTALRTDLGELQSAYELQKEGANNVRKLIEYVDGDLPFSEEVVSLFSSITRWVGIESNSAPYEALKSRGFDLISNEEIRLRLIDYYENKWPPLENTYLNDREFVRRNVVPYFLVHFKQGRGHVYVPLDFNGLKKDPHFRNLCMTKINRIDRFTLPNYEASLAVIASLIDLVGGEIGIANDA